MTTKVLHLINGEFYAGAERVQDLLALHLPQFGYECGFACLKPVAFPEMRRAQTAPLHLLPMASRVDLSQVWRIARLLKRDGYRLLHTHTARTALMGRWAATLARVPMVHHVHSPTSRDTEHAFRNWANALVENRVVLPWASKLVPVSSSLRGYLLERGALDGRISVVHNGVPTINPVCHWREPGGDWILGMVALFRPRKGLEVLIDALARLRRLGFPVRLLAVGKFETPDYENAVRGQVQRLGLEEFVEWTGFTRDVAAHMARMSVFVLPSLFGEGLPMVMIEAMGAGLPVVATRVEGIPEVLGPDGAGVLVSPGDAAGLAEGIGWIIKQGADVERIALAGHARQKKFFSADAMARGVATVYDEVLAVD